MSCSVRVKLLVLGFLFFAYCDILLIECSGEASHAKSPSEIRVPVCSRKEDLSDACIVNLSSCLNSTLNQTNENCLLLVRSLNHADAEQSQFKLSNLDVWIYSLGSAFFISLSGIWGYLFLPLMTGPYRDHVLNVLIGISFGSIITSALCQLIPEAYELGKITASSNYLYVAGISMMGLWLTWFLQGFASIIGKDYSETKKTTKPIANVELKTKNKSSNNSAEKTNNCVTVYAFPADVEHVKQTIPGEMKTHDEFPVMLKPRANSFASYTSLKKKSPKLSKLAIVILIGDFLNNFMDGISIGAGFSYYFPTGVKLMIAIAFEEYTHKLGDFAIVFQSGVPMCRVLFWNYVTSCACFVGIAIGIALGSLQWAQYIFSFASGLFLIIALSNMIPEMQHMLDESLEKSRKSGVITLLEQHIGFLFAFVLLVIISVILNANSAIVTTR